MLFLITFCCLRLLGNIFLLILDLVLHLKIYYIVYIFLLEFFLLYLLFLLFHLSFLLLKYSSSWSSLHFEPQLVYLFCLVMVRLFYEDIYLYRLMSMYILFRSSHNSHMDMDSCLLLA